MLRSVFTVRHSRLAVVLEGGHVLEVGDPNIGEEYKLLEILHDGQDKPGANGVDIAYSADASMVAMATEDKRVRVWRTGRVAEQTTGGDDTDEGSAELQPGTLLGEREIPKKPTSVLFAPTKAGGGGGRGGGGGGGVGVEEGEVLVVSDKCGDAYAAPLPDPSVALKHLLGHTAMTITAMVYLKGGGLLATADRAEHIRVSQFPRTTIIHTYLLGHKDFVSALAPVPGDGVLLLSGGGDGRVGLWDVETGQGLAMISVRQACQDLADGDASAAAAETLLDEEEPSAGVADIDLEADSLEGGGDDKGVNADAEEGDGVEREVEAGVAAGDSKGGASEVGAGGDRDWGGGEGGDGVPISVSCSEDGKTVAVVVIGLEGLLLLSLSRGGEGEQGASLTPRARLQLPTVPIQAGFLDGELVVALPSSSSTDCMQAFALTDGREGAVPSKSGKARAKCMCINAKSRARGEGGSDGYTLKAAVPDEDATEALAGGLRKHKGTRNAGKSPSGWNNFSKRRDKKQDKKRKRGIAPRLALADDDVDSPASEAGAATIAVAATPNEVATPA